MVKTDTIVNDSLIFLRRHYTSNGDEFLFRPHAHYYGSGTCASVVTELTFYVRKLQNKRKTVDDWAVFQFDLFHGVCSI